MKKIFRNIFWFINMIFPLRISGFTWFMVFIQFFYLYQVFVTNDVGGISFSVQSVFLIFVSLLTVLVFFQLISTFLGLNRWGLVAAYFLGMIGFDLLVAYQFGVQEPLQWAVIADNFTSAFSLESLDMIISSLDQGALLYIPVFLVLFISLELWRKVMSNKSQIQPFRPKKLSIVVLYLGCIFLPYTSYDPLINFFRSMYNYYFSPVKISAQVRDQAAPAMISNADLQHLQAKYPDKPYIFLIAVESLNHSALGKSVNGQPYTPFLNHLQSKCVYVENFFGNSVQTAKGHFALLFSVIPSITGKTFTRYENLRLDSLAGVLSEYGYETTFFSAHKNKNFDNTFNFVTQRGFKHYITVADFLTEEDKQKELRWGVEDAVF